MLGAGKSPVKRKLVAPTSLPEEHTSWTTLDYYVEADISLNLWDLTVNSCEEASRLGSSYDEIHAYEVLEHFGTQGIPEHFFNTFNHLWRALKPGGLLIGTTPGQSPVWGWGDPGHTRIISPESFIWLEKKNYENIGTGNPMSDYSSLIAPYWWEKQHSEYASPHTFCFWLKKVVE